MNSSISNLTNPLIASSRGFANGQSSTASLSDSVRPVDGIGHLSGKTVGQSIQKLGQRAWKSLTVVPATAVKARLNRVGTSLSAGFKAVKAAFGPVQKGACAGVLAGAAIGVATSAAAGAVACFALGCAAGPAVAIPAAVAGGVIGAGLGGLAGGGIAKLGQLRERNIEQQRQRAADPRLQTFYGIHNLPSVVKLGVSSDSSVSSA